MKTKKSILFAVIMFTQFCVSFGQYVYNFQGVYPVNNLNASTTNFTLARGIGQDGYLLATNPQVTSTRNDLLGIKVDNDFNIQFYRAHFLLFDDKQVKVETKDAISTEDKGYVICGNVLINNIATAFIAKFDENFKPIWGQVYPEITYLNSVIEKINNGEIFYLAAGTRISSETTAQPGVILCVDKIGNPVWENNTGIYTTTYKVTYNQIIEIIDPDQPTAEPFFAVVGNAIVQPMNNKNVIVTKINIKGDNSFSNIYGNPNSLLYTYDEEAYGICNSLKSQLIICGRTKYTGSHVLGFNDVLLFSIDNNSGNVNWIYRYNIPKNINTGECGQNVISIKEDVYVNGYYEGTEFNPTGSNDAFLLKTNYVGSFKELRAFGDAGQEKIFRLMLNNKGDGITNAGYSSDYVTTPSKFGYSPYIIESYEVIKEKCHDAYYETPNIVYNFPHTSMGYRLKETPVKELQFQEFELDVQLVVPCPKIPFVDDKVMSINNKTIGKISLYPTITTTTLNISGVNSDVEYTIFTQQGAKVLNGILHGNNTINVSDLNAGMYILYINDNANPTYFKFIKE